MKKITKGLMAVCLIGLFILGHSAFSAAGETDIPVTIKGNIVNIDNVGPYINSATHLQLYPCESTGKMQVQMGKNGKIEPVPGQEAPRFYLDGFNRLVPPSSLPRVGLPMFGTFAFFRVKELEPGKCYKVCVMMMDNQYPGMISLAHKDGRPLQFIIPEPEEGEEVVIVDLTKDNLIIPEPGMLKKGMDTK